MAQICALARYTIVARLLGPEQLGLAAIIILIVQFLESLSDSGGDRYLIQDQNGASPEAQKLVQAAFVIRGLIIATCLAILAVPAAAWVGEPAFAAALLGVALSPLIGGFVHLDMRRAQREKNFSPEALALISAEILGLAATLIAVHLARDFTALLYGLVTRSAVLVIVSHLCAERPYNVGYSNDHAARLLKFAGPLVLNGALLFAAGQGDRLIIANWLGPIDLGHYTAVLLLVLYPTSMAMRYLSAIHLPRIAGAPAGSSARRDAAELMGGLCNVGAVAVALGFAVAAPIVVPLIYGSAFKAPALLLMLIGVLQASRLLRQWPVTVALALGRSDIVLWNAIARLIGLPAAVAGTLTIGGLEGLVGGLIFGELIAIAAGLIMINLDGRLGSLWGFGRLAIFMGIALFVIVSLQAVARPKVIELATLVLIGSAFAATLAWIEWPLLRVAHGAICHAAFLPRRR